MSRGRKKEVSVGDIVGNGNSYRTVLKTGQWGVRVSCTNLDHSQHTLNKCYLGALWSDEQLKENGYDRVDCICPKRKWSNYYLIECEHPKHINESKIAITTE